MECFHIFDSRNADNIIFTKESESMSVCISLTNINHSFGSKQILHDLNLEVPQSKIFGLLGPSGCGKTTTVKIMAGIMEASSGFVYVLNEQMPDLTLMSRIGYMAQSDALYPLLTAEENLYFFSGLYGMKKSKAKERIDELMLLVDLYDHRTKVVSTYSGGMKRRLSLATALLHEPEVLILDEPTVGIDPILRKNIWEALHTMTTNGMSIIITTHVMDEADKCHQLAMMREGRLIAQGTPFELQERVGAKTIEEAFIYYGEAPKA
jgi:ABC-2 type transport system ATP-binding protein